MPTIAHTDPRSRDRRLNGYLRIVAPQGRVAVRIGPFLATFDPESDNPYRNYAIPDDDAAPDPADVALFAEAAASRGRIPRLEYAPAAAPEVEPALVAAGFRVELRPPVMTCTPQTHIAGDIAPGGATRLIRQPGDLEAACAVLNEAYAEHGFPADGRVDRLLDLIRRGGGVALATIDGEAAGAGCFTPIAHGLTEVAGIGVAPTYRNRGLAGALASILARGAFAKGAELAFLTPGVEAAQRAYSRAGFEAGTEMLMISRPPPAR